MQKKVIKARHFILNMLENGTINTDDKLPGARKLAALSGISFVKIQEGIDSLVHDGILKTKSRQGTFVKENWQEKIIKDIISIYGLRSKFCWLNEVESLIHTHTPDLMFSYAFPKAAVELRTSICVIHDQNDYMDLTPIFKELYPDNSDFFLHAFTPFKTDNKLFGIPFSISPRVLYINKNWLKKANCSLPQTSWTWQEFLNCITQLKTVLPVNRIFNFHTRPYLWMNCIFRTGGCLISNNSTNPVQIDTPETQHGIELFRQLQQTLSTSHIQPLPYYDRHFAAGDCAIYLATRQYLPQLINGNTNNWQTLPLPQVANGRDINVQGTDLLCIRKSCPDMDRAKNIIKAMLSTDTQDILARERYGIPVRKSSAVKSIDFTDPNDTLFLNELPKMSANYNINSPELSDLIYKGISDIWEKNLNIKQTTANLANAVRTLLAIKNNQ